MQTQKETLGNVHPQEKSNGHLIFLSYCHGSSQILGYICFSLIKVMLHSDDSTLFAVFSKSKEYISEMFLANAIGYSFIKFMKQVAFLGKLMNF